MPAQGCYSFGKLLSPTDRVPDPLSLGKIFTLPLQAKDNHCYFSTKYRFTLTENRQNPLFVIHLLPFCVVIMYFWQSFKNVC